MVDLSYAYANARVKGMKSNLLDENVFRELMQVKTVDGVAAVLEQTPYKRELVEASKTHAGVQMIDIALHNNLVKTLSIVGRILPSGARQLFALLTAEWSAQSIKLVISKKMLGQPVSETDLIAVLPEDKLFLEKLARSKTVREDAEEIARSWGSKEFRSAMRKLIDSSGSSDLDLRKVIREVENERARKLALLSKTADALTAKIIEQQLALESVMVVLRLRKEGVQDAEQHVIYKNPLVNRLLRSGDFEQCLKETAKAFELPAEVAEQARHSLSLLEIALERKVVERTLRLTRLSVLSFAAAIGFVFLKNVEVSNLRKIAYAHAYGLKEEIRDYVFAVNA